MIANEMTADEYARLAQKPRKCRNEPTSEKQFMQAVIDLASRTGWLVYHTFDSRRSAAGFLDLVLLKGPWLLFVECKTDRGRLSAAQELWLASLTLCGYHTPNVRAVVWRPRDWPEIERELTK